MWACRFSGVCQKWPFIHYGFVLPLDAASFEVLAFSDSTNPFMGKFRLKDRNGTYAYDSMSRVFAAE